MTEVELVSTCTRPRDPTSPASRASWRGPRERPPRPSVHRGTRQRCLHPSVPRRPQRHRRSLALRRPCTGLPCIRISLSSLDSGHRHQSDVHSPQRLQFRLLAPGVCLNLNLAETLRPTTNDEQSHLLVLGPERRFRWRPGSPWIRDRRPGPDPAQNDLLFRARGGERGFAGHQPGRERPRHCRSTGRATPRGRRTAGDDCRRRWASQAAFRPEPFEHGPQRRAGPSGVPSNRIVDVDQPPLPNRSALEGQSTEEGPPGG